MKIVRDGIPYVLAPLIPGLVFALIGFWILAILSILLSGFMAFFFRDPNRQPPEDPNLVVAPADGRITRVKRLEPGEEDSPVLVSIFLSPLDVHINRAPIAGQITNMSYTPGKFLMATKEAASELNEQNALSIEGDNVTVVCKQIAGILARRIVCWKRTGERVTLGERFGMIKFGSRTDLILPVGIEVLATEGMRVKGGTTIIGRLR